MVEALKIRLYLTATDIINARLIVGLPASLEILQPRR
jgi:hypothetical protein